MPSSGWFKIRWPEVLTMGDLRTWHRMYGRWERKLLNVYRREMIRRGR